MGYADSGLSWFTMTLVLVIRSAFDHGGMHTEQQRLLKCGSPDGQYKSYGEMMNSPIFSFWTMLFSSRFTMSCKKVSALSTYLSALDVTMPWPLCLTGTGLGRNGTEVDSEADFWMVCNTGGLCCEPVANNIGTKILFFLMTSSWRLPPYHHFSSLVRPPFSPSWWRNIWTWPPTRHCRVVMLRYLIPYSVV